MKNNDCPIAEEHTEKPNDVMTNLHILKLECMAMGNVKGAEACNDALFDLWSQRRIITNLLDMQKNKRSLIID